jgi:hypothetical protein
VLVLLFLIQPINRNLRSSNDRSVNPTRYCNRGYSAASPFVVSSEVIEDDIGFVWRDGVMRKELTDLGGCGTDLIQRTVFQILRICDRTSLLKQ